MKVLVTGCAGLIGSNFCAYLAEHHKDVDVVGVDNLSGGYIENIPASVTFIQADLTKSEDQSRIEAAFPVDIIFHFAAYAAEGLSPFIRQFNYTNNVVPTAFLVNCAIKHNIKRFVFTSSMAVYGENTVPFSEDAQPQPIDPYGIAKYACEMDIQVASLQHDLDYCIIRPHNVYGKFQNIWDPYRNVLGIWMLKASEGEPLTVYGDGEQTRAFSYIDDVVPCLWAAGVSDKARNQIINVGGTQSVSLNQAAAIVSRVTGQKEIHHLEPRHEVKHAWSTFQKSVELLDYHETVDLQQGLERMWAWVKTCPSRQKQYWDSYELEKKLYSFWKR